MSFSSLAGSVGGGQQTPGFIGMGKMFLSSRKFLAAEGGIKRLVWLPRELKETLGPDLRRRFEEEGAPDLLEKIADETVTCEAGALRAHLEKTGHPALEMEDMGRYAESQSASAESAMQQRTAAAAEEPSHGREAETRAEPEAAQGETVHAAAAARVEEEVLRRVEREIKERVTREVVEEIIRSLSRRFLDEEPAVGDAKTDGKPDAAANTADPVLPARPPASERLAAIKAFPLPRETWQNSIWEVACGATPDQDAGQAGGYRVGGETCMPFHLWEGSMPHRPRIAMEVFDRVSEKHPPWLRDTFGDLLADPPAMAAACVQKYGADLISVRLDGTHPERGNYSAEQAVELVRACRAAVEVPLIVTGHNHYEKNSQVLKAVAQACEGANLLLNWVEQDNYRTIAGAALAYGHCVVAQSPIDVNIAKQLNILLTNMGLPRERIIMDPMTGATGYGLEYTYSVMERIRLAGLGGDEMLAGPMIVSPGQECARTKEAKASQKDFPQWGPSARRAALWEFTTGLSLLHAGADILIFYNPEAAMAARKAIIRLMDQTAKD
jgi:acetyl-CoA decarbonylase/synthase complex subunit delta